MDPVPQSATSQTATSRIPLDPAALAARVAAQQYGRDSVERVLLQLCRGYRLQTTDIGPAAEADRKYGFEAARLAVELGFRGIDIVPAAAAMRGWPSITAARMSFERARALPKGEPVRDLAPGEETRMRVKAIENVAEKPANGETPIRRKEGPAPRSGETSIRSGETTLRMKVVEEPTPAEAPPVELTEEIVQQLTGMGFPPEDHQDAARALKAYPTGLAIVAPWTAGKIHGPTIYHAAYAGEKHPKDSVERVITKLAVEHLLEGLDILHAAASDRQNGFEATEIAVQLGWRKMDIGHAAQAAKLWPSLSMGRDGLTKMRKLFTKLRADVMEEDIRHCATVLRNMGDGYVDLALRERHPKNEREPWFRAISIQLVAWAYKLSAPHAGPAIDECRKRGGRRDKMGFEILSCLSRKFGRPIGPPPWLGGGKE